MQEENLHAGGKWETINCLEMACHKTSHFSVEKFGPPDNLTGNIWTPGTEIFGPS